MTANSKLSKVYNGANHKVSGFSATGLVNGETAAVLTSVNTGAMGKNSGTYSAIAPGTDNNYELSFVGGRLLIAPKEAEVASGGAEALGTASTGNAPTGVYPRGAAGMLLRNHIFGECRNLLDLVQNLRAMEG